MIDTDALVRQLLGSTSEPATGDWRAARAITLQLVREYPASIYDIAVALMHSSCRDRSAVGAILAFLPTERWSDLVDHALTMVRQDKDNEMAMGVLAEASYQAPTSLHPYLAETMLLGEHSVPDLRDAFHGARLTDVDFLMDRSSASGYDEVDLVRCLLESRLPEAVMSVEHRCPDNLAYYLAGVGIEKKDGAFRQLYPDQVLHLSFPIQRPDQLPTTVRIAVSWYGPVVHPTWAAPRQMAARHRFGGLSTARCERCGDTIHHLLTVAPVPGGLGVTGLPRLTLAACLACLSEEGTLSYRHDPDGDPHDLPHYAGFTSERREWEPLPETEVALVDLGPRWQWQELGNPQHNVNRLGGHPMWVQYPEYLPCPLCNQIMSFLLQLQLDELTVDGLGYVLWCDQCRVSLLLTQQT